MNAESLLFGVLAQLAVILAAARLLGCIARRFRQTTVVGEIVAGILLGPSFFGLVWPDTWQSLFEPRQPGVKESIVVLAQLGVLFMMFLAGLEFDFRQLFPAGRAALLVLLASTVAPFATGYFIAPLPHDWLGQTVPLEGLRRYLGLTLAITALPVLARILMELGITRTRLATIALAAAAVGDAIAWIALAMISNPAANPAGMIAATLGLVAATALIVRPLSVAYFRWAMRGSEELSLTPFVVVILMLLAMTILSNLAQIFSVFGAFVLGAALSDQAGLRRAVNARLQAITVGVFLPIFFACTGLRTDLTALAEPPVWRSALVILAASFAAKYLAVAAAARLSGIRFREAFILGAMMNTRGIMELVVINLGYERGLIPRSLLSILVLTVVVSNLFTMPLIQWLQRGTELEKAKPL